MIVTTTPSVEGHNIVEYKGIVFGEVIAGVNDGQELASLQHHLEMILGAMIRVN